MSSLNMVMLVGNLGRDPEVRRLPDGRPVARFSLATSQRWRGEKGELQSRTEWHRIVAFGPLADTTERYLRKGKNVLVEGRIQTRSYVNKAGAKAYSTEIVMRRLLMLGRKDGGADTAAGAVVAEEEPEFDDQES